MSGASLKTLRALADFLCAQGAYLQIFCRNSAYLSLEYLGCAVGDNCVTLHQRGSLRSQLMYESLWRGSPPLLVLFFMMQTIPGSNLISVSTQARTLPFPPSVPYRACQTHCATGMHLEP